jgi:hypothetical protein
MITQCVDLPNIGYVISDVDKNVLLDIYNEIDSIDFNTAETYHTNLVGNISHEFTLTKCRESIEKFAIYLATVHEEKYRSLKLVNDNTLSGKLKLSTLWVNFQQKHEFNPIHKHRGLYSFVIWIDIPFSHEEESLGGPGYRSPGNKSGCFEFIYTNSLGMLAGEQIMADLTYNGKMILFPARLNHTVYPFYSSDRYRVSVSGNLYME